LWQWAAKLRDALTDALTDAQRVEYPTSTDRRIRSDRLDPPTG
jgi:hypothetical protein